MQYMIDRLLVQAQEYRLAGRDQEAQRCMSEIERLKEQKRKALEALKGETK